jgi:hypothetical protein
MAGITFTSSTFSISCIGIVSPYKPVIVISCCLTIIADSLYEMKKNNGIAIMSKAKKAMKKIMNVLDIDLSFKTTTKGIIKQGKMKNSIVPIAHLKRNAIPHPTIVTNPVIINDFLRKSGNVFF